MEGVTLDEAKPRHRQIYEASGDIHARYSPHNIGHAAAYETYRIWTHNPSIRGLGADYSQRCEVFIAIAIAEGQAFRDIILFRSSGPVLTCRYLFSLLFQFPTSSELVK